MKIRSDNFNQILQTADLVKFARSKPPTSQAENDRKSVEEIVIRTKEATTRNPQRKN